MNWECFFTISLIRRSSRYSVWSSLRCRITFVPRPKGSPRMEFAGVICAGTDQALTNSSSYLPFRNITYFFTTGKKCTVYKNGLTDTFTFLYPAFILKELKKNVIDYSNPIELFHCTSFKHLSLIPYHVQLLKLNLSDTWVLLPTIALIFFPMHRVG